MAGCTAHYLSADVMNAPIYRGAGSCLATLPVRLPERVNKFCEPSSAEPQVKWAEFATTVRLIIFPPIIVFLMAWRAESGTRGHKWRVTYIRRLEPSYMDLQPALEKVTVP